jgi:flagellin
MTSIHTNVGALVAQRGMDDSMQDLNTAMNRLSTGYRINSAADDAAGSAIASKFEAQTRSLGVAIRNANDAVSLTQTAEGALGEVENILQRMRELSVQAGNSTLNASDRATIQAEIDALAQEIDAISTKTNFNQVNLLDGTRGSVSMQIGIDKGDELSIALQKTDVSSLGIGSSATKRVLTSERVSALPNTGDGNDLLSGDIKINGQDAFSSDLTTSSVTGLSFAATDLEAALAANTRHAGAMAAVINTNSAVHGATASAFNTVRGASSAYTAGGTITVNGETIANNSKQGFVDEVNNSAAGVQASIDDAGRIVFSNDDGDTIVLAGAQIANVGHVAATYAGFIQIENADGSDVTIEAGNTANGYGSSAAGTVGDLNAFGFNQNFGTTVRGNATTSTALTSAMNVKINGVAIGASTDGSALSKAAAINAANAGVTASAKTVAKLTIDLVGVTNSQLSDFSVNDITIDISGDLNTGQVASGINDALRGVIDIVASQDSTTGELVLTSESGLTIDANSGTATGFITAVTNQDGVSVTAEATGDYVTQGLLTLVSNNGGAISLEDGESGTHTGLDTLGLQGQSQKVTTTSAGLDVGSVSNATAALTAIDTAIEQVSSFRAEFGAYENRLDSAISNLTTYKTNLEASQGRITDADFASETSNLTKAQILQQAATAMLAQANASKQGLLALLQG